MPTNGRWDLVRRLKVKPVAKILLHHLKHVSRLMMSSRLIIKLDAGSIVMKLNVM